MFPNHSESFECYRTEAETYQQRWQQIAALRHSSQPNSIAVTQYLRYIQQKLERDEYGQSRRRPQ